MKRLNLDETWVLCLAMWKWIAQQVRAAIKAGKAWDVNNLKAKWCRKHGYSHIDWLCFFCEYILHNNRSSCKTSRISPHCPGRKVDKKFNCQNKEYQFENKPIAFYKKLLALNKIRLAKKR